MPVRAGQLRYYSVEQPAVGSVEIGSVVQGIRTRRGRTMDQRGVFEEAVGVARGAAVKARVPDSSASGSQRSVL